MTTQKYDRFKAAPWFQEGVRPTVLVGGAGGIGSWLTILLNRAGFETFVYDHDTLEAINMAGQLYMHKSIGQAKVDALAEIVKEVCQDDIIATFGKIDDTTMSNDIVFSAFDNMKARTDMFTTWAMNFSSNPKAIFIDGRLTAEQLTIFCVKGDNLEGIAEYSKTHLFPDSDVEELACTFKQTSHGAAMIAAHMVQFFTNWYSGVLGKDTSRSTPFYWEYMIPIDFMQSGEVQESSFNWENRPEDAPVIIEVLPIEKIPDTINLEIASERVEKWARAIEEATSITPEEIQLIDQFLEQKGLPNPADPNLPSNSLTFEEDNNIEELPYTSPNTNLSDLPF